MNIDEYGDILNGYETYKLIAKVLKEKTSIIIGWTDENSTHFDILLSYRVVKIEENYLQSGLRWSDLFVSIMGYRCFRFYNRQRKRYWLYRRKIKFRI